MEIKLPKRTEDLRIKHYKALKNPLYGDNMELGLTAKFVSEFSGVPENLVRKIDIEELVRVYNHCVGLLAEYKLGEPPKEITINNIKYKRIEPEKVSSGWHIDFGNTDIENELVRLACLFYYPSDGVYGDTDENHNLVHPIHERYNDFEEHFPLTLFLDAAGFFLLKSKELINKYMEIKKMEIHTKLLLNFISGRRV